MAGEGGSSHVVLSASPPAQSLNDKVLSLESRLEKEQKELHTGKAPAPLHLGMRQGVPRLGRPAWTSGLQGLKKQKPHPGHCPHCPSVCVPGYSEMLLRVQQLVETTDSLTCRMATLKSNGEAFPLWLSGNKPA